MPALLSLDNLTVVERVGSNPLTISSDASLTRTREFVVKLRDITDSSLPASFIVSMVPVLLLKSPQIPKWHSHDPLIPGMWCTEVAITLSNDDVNVWTVTCSYEGISIPGRGVSPSDYTSFFGTSSGGGSTPFLERELPWHAPPELIMEPADVQEVITGRAYDYVGTATLDGSASSVYTSDGGINLSTGSPWDVFDNYVASTKPAPRQTILNSVGEQYTDVPAITTRNKTYTWRWSMPALMQGSTPFESGNFMSNWGTVEGTFNTSDITIMGIGIPKFTGMVKEASQKKLAFMGYPYYEFTLTVTINKAGWLTPILNKGTKYKLTSDASTYTPYNTETGGTEALKLKPDGTALPDGSDSYWGCFVMHPWKDWSFLSLPSESNPSYFAAGVGV